MSIVQYVFEPSECYRPSVAGHKSNILCPNKRKFKLAFKDFYAIWNELRSWHLIQMTTEPGSFDYKTAICEIRSGVTRLHNCLLDIGAKYKAMDEADQAKYKDEFDLAITKVENLRQDYGAAPDNQTCGHVFGLDDLEKRQRTANKLGDAIGGALKRARVEKGADVMLQKKQAAAQNRRTSERNRRGSV